MRSVVKTTLIVGGVVLVSAHIAINPILDTALQGEIKHLCDINGGSATRTLQRDNTSSAVGLHFLLRSDVDGGLDSHHAQVKLSELAYYAVNLKVAQLLHRRHYVTLVIDCRQDPKSQQPGKLASRATFYVSEAEYRH